VRRLSTYIKTFTNSFGHFSPFSMMGEKVEYIHQNPDKRGYVDQLEHWRCLSARNYSGMNEGVTGSVYKRVGQVCIPTRERGNENS
jgi:hypothetical protein